MRQATVRTLCIVAGLLGVGTGALAQQPPGPSGGSRVALQVLAGGLGAVAGTVGLAMLGLAPRPGTRPEGYDLVLITA